MQNYLCNRSQKTKVNGSFSDWAEILGISFHFLFFLFFRNDSVKSRPIFKHSFHSTPDIFQQFLGKYSSSQR